MQIIDDRLVSLLEAAVHIQYLYFPNSISDLVFNAAMKVHTLHELHAVCGTYQESMRIRLPTFRSPLRSLCIEEPNHLGDNISAGFLHGRLSHLAPTPEALDLGYFNLEILPSSIMTPFTAVRSLKFMVGAIFKFHGLAVLLSLFPNLDNTLVLRQPFRSDLEEETLLPLRAPSEEAQRAHTWAKLDRLVCDAELAFVLALQCPIRRMDIQACEPEATRYLADALRYNCPQRLHLSLSFRYGLGILDGLLPSEAVDRLTHLVIFAEIEVHHKLRAPSRRKRIRWNRFFVHKQHLLFALRSP